MSRDPNAKKPRSESKSSGMSGLSSLAAAPAAPRSSGTTAPRSSNARNWNDQTNRSSPSSPDVTQPLQPPDRIHSEDFSDMFYSSQQSLGMGSIAEEDHSNSNNNNNGSTSNNNNQKTPRTANLRDGVDTLLGSCTGISGSGSGSGRPNRGTTTTSVDSPLRNRPERTSVAHFHRTSLAYLATSTSALPPPPPPSPTDTLDVSQRSFIEIGHFSERVTIPLVELHPTSMTSRNSNRSQQQQQQQQQQQSITSTTSTRTGMQTLRLSVLPATIINSPDNSGDTMSTLATNNSNISHPLQPRQLLDVETGRSILIAQQQQHTAMAGGTTQGQVPTTMTASLVTCRQVAPIAKQDVEFFQERSSALQSAMGLGCMLDFEINSEVGVLGGAWRGVLKRLVLWAFDHVNAERLSRALQLSLPFQTGYECYVTSQVIEALDRGHKKDLDYILSVAFQNRNVSRVLVQAMRPRYDFLWHWSTAVVWNRQFDALGQFPIIGITGFPASENFPATRDHALASIFRVVLGQGNWITRVVTRGREGLVTDNPKNTAQNLTAESNGFELANRNQYGTHFGRQKTNEFRLAHRLPTDESLLRTFVAQPMSTMTNNGVVHVLRQLANHWENMLSQEWGNFAHQRMEQLDPFETLRFHMPEVLVHLSTLRGRNRWDSMVLGPMIQRLQNLKPAFDASDARVLIHKLKENIVLPICGGVASLVDPFRRWLDAISESCNRIEKEARKVYEIVTSVEIGIRLGHDLVTQVSWKIPSDAALKKAILNHILGESTGEVSERRVRSALHLTTPRDKRTLIELVKNKLGRTEPAQLLLSRVKTLLQREIRRETLNEAIQQLSMGDYVYDDLVHDEWYWVEKDGVKGVYIYDEKVSGSRHRFIQVASGFQKVVSLKGDKVKIRTYVPIAEAISRAQKAFMTIELDYGKIFKYNAFMEFTYLRIALRRLVVVSQTTCEELDNARLNLLHEIQRSNQMQLAPEELIPGTTYYIADPVTKTCIPFVSKKEHGPGHPDWDKISQGKIVKMTPQSIIVVGGGPTGLIATIHCTENCLISGGEMKLFEARDAFAKGGSTFERAQIVRLDARWIAMLRYHLGTIFEDVYIPASGETDSQLGNTLPSQGFVEITIKDLENMLHTEVSRLWSKGVINVFTDSRAAYDPVTNSLTKFGENLKVDDIILRRVNEDGHPCGEYHSWKVAELVYTRSLGIDDLKVGEDYAVFIRLEQAVLPFKLVGVDLDQKTYTFRSLSDGIDNLKVNAQSLPSVYPSGTGTKAHADVHQFVFENVKESSRGGFLRDALLMSVIKKERFTLHIGNTHVLEAVGKPYASQVHFPTTTTEPYAVCCIQGLKVSLGMHNFGEKRWKNGIVDDIRSQNDQNTRIVGDFTKMVRTTPIARRMFTSMSQDPDWTAHFDNLVLKSSFPELNEFDPIVPKIIEACKWLAENTEHFRRQTLQTRFFETGDNYYLGMELTREYDRWKKGLAEELVAPLKIKIMSDGKKREVEKLKGALMHHIDRLWYDGCLETIREGDVYNPGARRRVPHFYLINSYKDMSVGSLAVGESFRRSSSPEEKYEILAKRRSQVVVRNVEGYIFKMGKSILVKREGNLTRGPDGNQESNVALASFPLGHYVNHRTMRLSDKEKGYVFAFIGDAQATPHFMRYSGLTGGCINAMSFNTFIKQAIEEVPFVDRFRRYSEETNWSNGEVVQRGTGSNYGKDGFLRPGFSYTDCMDYLRSKVIEYRESDQDLNNILSHDWKVKIAASIVPRGMEVNTAFMKALHTKLHNTILENFLQGVKADDRLRDFAIGDSLRVHRLARRTGLASERSWDQFLNDLDLDEKTKKVLEDPHIFIAKHLGTVCKEVTDFAANAYLYNRRISSELCNQPKPVDSVVDDFAVEAQNFASSLTLSAAFGAGALAFRLMDSDATDIASTALGILNILISFGTMTNVARYKIRNEEARIAFKDEKLSHVSKAVFSLMDRKTRDSIPLNLNPFVVTLEKNAESFRKQAEYYDYPEPNEFMAAFAHLKREINDVDIIRAFQKAITSKFLVDTYHVNSYVQEILVDMYRTADDMLCLLTQPIEQPPIGGDIAEELFDRINAFETRLEGSLQRGPVRWGFVKQRKFVHWDIIVAIRYFYSLAFCSRARGSTLLGPIQTETQGILKQIRRLSALHQSKVLRRESRDFESAYWATRESDIASLMFLSGFFVFASSIVFSVARLGSFVVLEDFAFWATAASTLGAALASFHLVRKLFLLCGLWSVLGSKKKDVPSTDDRRDLRKIRAVTFTQILLTLARLGTAGAAAVALPFSVAENGYGDRIDTGEEIPFWIALGAVVTAVASTIFFFLVEYVVRYNLSPQLGPFVCEIFRDEIHSMYQVLTVPLNDIDSKQVQDREAWEYTAREFLHKYRFDTVFAADRFGQILQYIQSGMDPRVDYV